MTLLTFETSTPLLVPDWADQPVPLLSNPAVWCLFIVTQRTRNYREGLEHVLSDFKDPVCRLLWDPPSHPLPLLQLSLESVSQTSTSPHSLSSSSCLLTSLWGVVFRTSFVSLLPLQNRCYRTVTQRKDDENLHQVTSKFMDPVCILFLFVKFSSVQVFLDTSTLAFSFALVIIIRSFLPTPAPRFLVNLRHR
jgi:hypothetical protein